MHFFHLFAAWPRPMTSPRWASVSSHVKRMVERIQTEIRVKVTGTRVTLNKCSVSSFFNLSPLFVVLICLTLERQTEWPLTNILHPSLAVGHPLLSCWAGTGPMTLTEVDRGAARQFRIEALRPGAGFIRSSSGGRSAVLGCSTQLGPQLTGEGHVPWATKKPSLFLATETQSHVWL